MKATEEMRERRTIHELLLILKKSVEEAEVYEFKGLCWQITLIFRRGIINPDEMSLLRLYIVAVKPIDVGNLFWWPQGEKKPRLEFLDKELLKTGHLKI